MKPFVILPVRRATRFGWSLAYIGWW